MVKPYRSGIMGNCHEGIKTQRIWIRRKSRIPLCVFYVSSVVFNLFFYQDYAPNGVIATKASRRKRFGFEENQGYTYLLFICLLWFKNLCQKFT